MLNRQNYSEYKRVEIEQLILKIINNLIEMMSQFDKYLLKPTTKNKDDILKIEDDIDRNVKKIEKYILEIISLEQLGTTEIQWLFSMSRIIRELERVGDQLTNIITFSDVLDINILRPMIRDFFEYEYNMMKWLNEGIQDHNPTMLQEVIAHDQYVNVLNKEVYQGLVDLIKKEVKLTESRLKMVIVSRFLERIGDHLVNSARTYMNLLDI